MKKIYALFCIIPILFFILLYLSVWWFMGAVVVIMIFIIYRLYAEQLQASYAKTGLLEQELEELHIRLENAVLKEQKTSKEAEQIKLLKQQLLSVISHEVRTPMNGVLGMALLMEDTVLTKVQLEYTHTIRNCSESLLTTINNILVNDILDFSKIQQEGLHLDYKDFDLRDCVEEVLDLFAAKVGKAGIDLVYEIDENVPEHVIGDNKRLRQVLMNLLENAVKFTNHGEIFLSIRISSNKDAGNPAEINFELRDSGIGISAGQLNQLFTGIPGKELKKNNQGDTTGLGLVICRKLVEMMGGRIEAKSKLEQGSTFTFSIPLTPSHKVLRNHSQQHNMIHLEGKSILIVDDNPTRLGILFNQMQSWKMLPVTANTAEMALEILSGNVNFGLVLTDMHMPGMGGIQLAKSIRSRFPATPVIGMNPSGDERYIPETEFFSSILTMPTRLYRLRDQLLNIFSPLTADKKNSTHMMTDEFAKQYPLRILVAEDNHINQKLAITILTKLGYEPGLAKNGKEALDLVSQEAFDLILMDIQMPEMNGLEATRMIRTCLEVQPVIIAVTANVMQGDRDECMQAGMDDYMSKPIEIKELIFQLEKWSQCKRTQSSADKNEK